MVHISPPCCPAYLFKFNDYQTYFCRNIPYVYMLFTIGICCYFQKYFNTVFYVLEYAAFFLISSKSSPPTLPLKNSDVSSGNDKSFSKQNFTAFRCFWNSGLFLFVYALIDNDVDMTSYFKGL